MTEAWCPNSPEHDRFTTVAHVMEEWVVDRNGNWISTVESLETTHKPDPDNTWTCKACGAEAVFDKPDYPEHEGGLPDADAIRSLCPQVQLIVKILEHPTPNYEGEEPDYVAISFTRAEVREILDQCALVAQIGETRPTLRTLRFEATVPGVWFTPTADEDDGSVPPVMKPFITSSALAALVTDPQSPENRSFTDPLYRVLKTGDDYYEITPDGRINYDTWLGNGAVRFTAGLTIQDFEEALQALPDPDA